MVTVLWLCLKKWLFAFLSTDDHKRYNTPVVNHLSKKDENSPRCAAIHIFSSKMDTTTSCGFDHDIFLVQPSHFFSCPICINVVNDPRQCTNGHIFCKSCVTRSLQSHFRCPMCNVDLSENTLAVNLVVKNMVSEMRTSCPSLQNISESGGRCDWTGSTHTREAHYQNDCPERLIVCSSVGCGAELPRRQMDAHLLHCSFRVVLCQGCQMQFPLDTLDFHQTQCACRSIVCMNNCGKRMEYWEMREHMMIECPNEWVQCPVLASGNHCTSDCPVELQRKDVLQHVQSISPQMLVEILGGYSALIKHNRELEKANLRELINVELVVIEGSNPSCNGLYKFTGIKHFGGIFEMKGYCNGRCVRYVIHKVLEGDGSFVWYLSLIDGNAEPGRGRNTAVYWASGVAGDDLPNNNFQCMRGNNTLYVAPKVLVRSAHNTSAMIVENQVTM